MPWPHLKTRGEDRKRLKRIEPPRERYRLKRLEPSYPIPGLFPGSRCPHPENPRPGYLCGCRDCVNRGYQVAIDQSPAPPPVNPEDRALAKIEEYKQAMEHLDPAKHHRLLAGLREAITKQRMIIDEYSGVPTKYKPDPKLKGGK